MVFSHSFRSFYVFDKLSWPILLAWSHNNSLFFLFITKVISEWLTILCKPKNDVMCHSEIWLCTIFSVCNPSTGKFWRCIWDWNSLTVSPINFIYKIFCECDDASTCIFILTKTVKFHCLKGSTATKFHWTSCWKWLQSGSGWRSCAENSIRGA